MHVQFTDQARQSIQRANEQAQRCGHEWVGTEHILLGLLDQESVAVVVLTGAGVDQRKVRSDIERIVRTRAVCVSGTLPQTPRAKKVLEYAIAEARSLRHHAVGTQHLLLGLLREGEGVAAHVLINLGLRLEHVREACIHLPATEAGAAAEPAPDEKPAAVRAAEQELDKRLERVWTDIEDAIAAADFETAVGLRDQRLELQRQRKTLPYEWAVAHPPDVLWKAATWSTIAKRAGSIGREQRWADLPSLADDLEAAGCNIADVLNHCRNPGVHLDRCWVVDWVLGQL
jgi:ATP-dependent Clp protease ATP-binding subunit ClpA